MGLEAERLRSGAGERSDRTEFRERKISPHRATLAMIQRALETRVSNSPTAMRRACD
jgi:hypothetical protein